MPLIVTPRQFTQRAELYHQLSQLTVAGLPIVSALEQLARNPPARSYREPIRRTLESISKGCSFSESWQAGQRLPALDLALLQAGEQSGRLPNSCLELAELYRDRAQLMRSTLLLLTYPLFILHFAIMIFPLDRLTGLVLRGEVFAFLWQKFLILGPLWGIVIFGVLASQGEASSWRAFIERVLSFLPVLGRARRSLAIARLSSALEALISAGTNIIAAWELAADASASPALQRVIRDAKPQLASGRTPAEIVRASREFPHVFADMYHTGEVSGKLDESLERAHAYFQEEGSRKLKQFMVGCVSILIATVMLLVAWQIIQFYVGYFQQINRATEGF